MLCFVLTYDRNLEFGTGVILCMLYTGKPLVDWVEGVAIIVAIFTVVCGFQLSHNLSTLTITPKGHGWFS